MPPCPQLTSLFKRRLEARGLMRVGRQSGPCDCRSMAGAGTVTTRSSCLDSALMALVRPSQLSGLRLAVWARPCGLAVPVLCCCWTRVRWVCGGGRSCCRGRCLHSAGRRGCETASHRRLRRLGRCWVCCTGLTLLMTSGRTDGQLDSSPSSRLGLYGFTTTLGVTRPPAALPVRRVCRDGGATDGLSGAWGAAVAAPGQAAQ